MTDSSQAFDQGVYLFCHGNSVRSNIPVLIRNYTVYMPAFKIFSLLSIYYTFDKTSSVLNGYIGHPDSAIQINFTARTAIYNSNRILINDSDIISQKDEIFISPLILNQLLNLRINIIHDSFSIILDSDKPLPVDDFIARKTCKTRIIPISSNALSLIVRNPSWFNGASADYQFGYVKSGLASIYNLMLNTGIELLGGDFQLGIRNSYDQSLRCLELSLNYRWRYFLGDNPWLTQFVAGNLANTSIRQSGLPRVNMTGIQVSNELPWTDAVFDTLPVERQIMPGWLAEVYSNGVRLDPSSDSGIARLFIFPAGYGTTTISTRYYGPRGEYSEYEEFFSVPYDFVSPGKVYYTLSAGSDAYSNRFAMDGRLSAGITSYITNSFCLEKQQGANGFDVFNKLSLRLPFALTAYIETSPGNYYRSSAASVINKGSLIGANYTIYDKASGFNRLGARSTLDLFGSFNNRFALPFNLNFSLQRTLIADYFTDGFWANLYMPLPFQKLLPAKYLFGLNSFNFRAMYSGRLIEQPGMSLNHRLNAELSFYHSGIPGHILGLSGFRLSADYDMTNSRLVKSEFILDQKFFNRSYFRASISRDFARGSFSANLGLVINLSGIKSVSSASLQQGYGLFSQYFQGSAGYDYSGRGIYANNMDFLSSVGYGSASVRFFLDSDNNGLRDENEKIIDDVDYDIAGGLAVKNSKGYTDFVCSLTPYAKYSVAVNTASFKNPLIVPKLKAFCFIADPNTCQIIDIPCYTTSVIEGSIILDEPLNKPFSLTLHITSLDSSFSATTTTFSDGSFYYMGLPPGEYRIECDGQELLLLGLKNKSPMPVISIMNTSKGDNIKGISLYLTRNH